MRDLLENKTYVKDLTKALSSIDLSLLNNKRIIITGGLGLICSTIVDLLHINNLINSANLDIYVADINEPFFYERYGKYNDIHYLKYNALLDIDFSIEADYIIHGAGLASPELYVTKPVETMLSNFQGLNNLLQYAIDKKAKSFLYISSSEVYGVKETTNPFTEESFGVCNINAVRTSYAEAKRASEVLCRAYSSEYGMCCVIARPGHIFGPTASKRDQRLSSAFIFKAINGEDLVLKTDGHTIRSYCYSVDCAVAILYILLFGKNQESYNVGHDDKTTIRNFSKIVADYTGVQLIIDDAVSNDIAQLNPMDVALLDNRKVKQLGYCDCFSVREGVIHTIDIVKQTYYE